MNKKSSIYSVLTNFSKYLDDSYFHNGKLETDFTNEDLKSIEDYFNLELPNFKKALDIDLNNLLGAKVDIVFSNVKIIMFDERAQGASLIKIYWDVASEKSNFKLMTKCVLFYNSVFLFVSLSEFEKIIETKMKNKLEKALDQSLLLP